jgi:hypothetical protein
MREKMKSGTKKHGEQEMTTHRKSRKRVQTQIRSTPFNGKNQNLSPKKIWLTRYNLDTEVAC